MFVNIYEHTQRQEQQNFKHNKVKTDKNIP